MALSRLRTTVWPSVLVGVGASLRQSLARDRRRVAGHVAAVDQAVDQDWHTTGLVQIKRDILSGRPHIADDGRSEADGLDIVQRELDAGFARECQAV